MNHFRDEGENKKHERQGPIRKLEGNCRNQNAPGLHQVTNKITK